MVPVPILATGTVPDAILEPFKLVIFEPLIADAVPDKFAAGKLVSDAPEPEKVPAVNVFELGLYVTQHQCVKFFQ